MKAGDVVIVGHTAGCSGPKVWEDGKDMRSMPHVPFSVPARGSYVGQRGMIIAVESWRHDLHVYYVRFDDRRFGYGLFAAVELAPVAEIPSAKLLTSTAWQYILTTTSREAATPPVQQKRRSNDDGIRAQDGYATGLR